MYLYINYVEILQLNVTLNKSYLEYSQITKARTARELNARELMKRIIVHLNEPGDKLFSGELNQIVEHAHNWLMVDMGSDDTAKWYDELN